MIRSTCASASSLIGVSESLRRIEANLARLGRRSTLELLRPGMTPPNIHRAVAELALRAHPDLVALYEWHDGTDTSSGAPLDDLHLFPGFYFLSLEDASADYAAFKSDARWDEAWLPVFANGGGDFYGVVCDPDRTDWGQVLHFRIDESRHPVEFHSLATMLTTIAAAYDDGIFYVDERGYLEMDDLGFAALAHRLNPDVEYWRS